MPRDIAFDSFGELFSAIEEGEVDEEAIHIVSIHNIDAIDTYAVLTDEDAFLDGVGVEDTFMGDHPDFDHIEEPCQILAHVYVDGHSHERAMGKAFKSLFDDYLSDVDVTEGRV